LVIELDGESHNDKVEQDKERTHYLKRHGYSVVRYLNDDVVDHLEVVVEDIFRRVSFAAKNVPGRRNNEALSGGPSPGPSLEGRGV
jgi:very-short-patch-repair endonuclease